jgi:probable rRNA maturation factor
MRERVEVAWTVRGPRPLSTAEVRRIVALALAHGDRSDLEVAVVFVSDPHLARMHADYLDDPSPTDVLAFELPGEGRGPMAELYVSVDRARVVARRRKLPPARELALYVVHGCLHLCGYDDHRPRERSAMRAAERRVLAKLGWAKDRTRGRKR